MTTRTSTKKKLIASILMLCMCFSMLAGTTFAWFTDSVSSDNNVIQTGTLLVEMHWLEGDEDPTTEKWNNAASGAIFESNLWEPGYAEAKHVKISNVGTLALKYQLRIVANSEFSKLADVIDVYYYEDATQLGRADLATATKIGSLTEVLDPAYENAIHKVVAGSLEAGKVDTLTLVLKMREDAGNEYQDLALTDAGFSIQLIATQYTSEKDSFGNDYDSEAIFPVITVPGYSLPTNGQYDGFNMASGDVTVAGTPDFEAEMAQDGVTELNFKADPPVVKDGVVTIADAAFYDQDDKKIDLTGNTEPLSVKVYVGKDYAGQPVLVYHDAKLVADVTVDANGYVAYKTVHFCEITVELNKELPAGAIIVDGTVVEADKIPEDKALTDIVEMIVGGHAYKVSYGMFKSWKETPTVKGQIIADVYLPEDLHAYSMMYKNGDLNMTGPHSDLYIKADLDFAGKTYEPIGRFYTNIHGENHKISNLNDSLFGCVYDCQLYDLTLENVNVSGSAAGIIAKELAGDAYAVNVTIAGKNSVTFVNDGKANWPEYGYGIGAVCGVSLIGCSAPANVNVAITGTVTLNYGENTIFYNNAPTKFDNLGISKEFGLNVYMPNKGATVTGAQNITTTGSCYMLLADGVGVNGNTYGIYNVNGMKWLADTVNAGNNMSGKTINLLADIDLENNEWTPIGYMGKTFVGTFDGNGHVIKNLKITKTLTNSAPNNGVGLFGRTDDPAVIKNFTIENVDITGSLYVGAVVGHGYTGKAIENVTVKGDVSIDAWWYAGVIGGYGYMNRVENCRVYANPGSYIKGNDGSYIGAIWGFRGEGKNDIVYCVAEGIDVTGVDRVGAIAGIAHYGNTIKDNFASNVVVTATDPEATTVGIIVGACQGTASEPSIFINNYYEDVTACISNGNGAYVETDRLFGTNIDGTEPVTNIAAKVNGQYYTSLAEAIEAVEDGGVISFVGNLTVTSKTTDDINALYYTGDKSFTLDLNGYTFTGDTSNAVIRIQKSYGKENTITIKNGNIVSGANSWSAISIGSNVDTKTYVNLSNLNISSCKANDMAVRARTGAEFTITDCVINATNGAGGIVAGGGNATLNNVTVNQSGYYSNNWNCVALGISGGGKITVNSGSYTSNPEGNANGTWVAYIMSSGGTLEINGGTFNGTTGNAARGVICADKAAIVNINGGTFNSTGAILHMTNNYGTPPNPQATIAGGTFSADPTVCGYGQNNLIKIADGYKAVESDGTYYVVANTVAGVVTNPETMKKALAAAGSAGAGNTTIAFFGDIDMSNTEWTPIKVDGYNGADIVTIEGNGATITGLTAPLFAGGFAGGSGIVIKDLTIADSNIVSTNTLGSGAFIESVDSMSIITLTNCHLVNSTVTGGKGSRTGGLIGWTAGYNNVNDGPVKTYVTIEDCSVVDCTITCDGSVGGIYGHAGNNAWTYSTIKNCTVKNCELNSTDDGQWRVGVVVGTANVGEVTISNITESGNTLTQTDKTAPEGQSNLYGRFVPGDTGKLFIDGMQPMNSPAKVPVAPLEEDFLFPAGTNAVLYKDVKMTGDAQIVHTENAVLGLSNVVAELDHDVIVRKSAGAILIENSEFTLTDGAKLITVGEGGDAYQVFLINVKVNGVLLTDANAGQYLEGISWFQAVPEWPEMN